MGSKKTRNNIFQQIKKLAANKKASRKSYKKPYSKNYNKSTTKPNIKIYKFTADEAVGKAALRTGKFKFESQKLERDTNTADSTSHITVTKYKPEQANSKVNNNKLPSQSSNWVPMHSERRSDSENTPQSYKITPDLVKGGYKVSPVSPTKKSSWLLRSPQGKEFHFKSLQQIYDLNENNFVPG